MAGTWAPAIAPQPTTTTRRGIWLLLSFDSDSDQALDDVALQREVDDHRGYAHQGRRAEDQREVGEGLRLPLGQTVDQALNGQGDRRDVLVAADEDEGTQVIVPDPDED